MGKREGVLCCSLPLLGQGPHPPLALSPEILGDPGRQAPGPRPPSLPGQGPPLLGPGPQPAQATPSLGGAKTRGPPRRRWAPGPNLPQATPSLGKAKTRGPPPPLGPRPHSPRPLPCRPPRFGAPPPRSPVSAYQPPGPPSGPPPVPSVGLPAGPDYSPPAPAAHFVYHHTMHTTYTHTHTHPPNPFTPPLYERKKPPTITHINNAVVRSASASSPRPHTTHIPTVSRMRACGYHPAGAPAPHPAHGRHPPWCAPVCAGPDPPGRPKRIYKGCAVRAAAATQQAQQHNDKTAAAACSGGTPTPDTHDDAQTHASHIIASQRMRGALCVSGVRPPPHRALPGELLGVCCACCAAAAASSTFASPPQQHAGAARPGPWGSLPGGEYDSRSSVRTSPGPGVST